MKLSIIALIASVIYCHTPDTKIMSDFVPGPHKAHGMENALLIDTKIGLNLQENEVVKQILEIPMVSEMMQRLQVSGLFDNRKPYFINLFRW